MTNIYIVINLAAIFATLKKQCCHVLKYLQLGFGNQSSQYYNCAHLKKSKFSGRSELNVPKPTYVQYCSLAKSRLFFFPPSICLMYEIRLFLTNERQSYQELRDKRFCRCSLTDCPCI